MQQTEIDLSGQNLTEIPPWVFEHASTLQYLRLGENQLTSLSEEIGSLTQLKLLDLRRNRLTFLPKEFGSIKQLTVLYLGENQLTSIPEEIGSLTQLVITLKENLLTTLPSNIENKIFNKEQVLKEIEQNKSWREKKRKVLEELQNKENKRKMLEELLDTKNPTEWVILRSFIMSELDMMPLGKLPNFPHFRGNHFEKGMELFDEITGD